MNLKTMLEVEITTKRTTMRSGRPIRTLLGSIHANLRPSKNLRLQNSQGCETRERKKIIYYKCGEPSYKAYDCSNAAKPRSDLREDKAEKDRGKKN
jgi:hypothetical protein